MLGRLAEQYYITGLVTPLHAQLSITPADHTHHGSASDTLAPLQTWQTRLGSLLTHASRPRMPVASGDPSARDHGAVMSQRQAQADLPALLSQPRASSADVLQQACSLFMDRALDADAGTWAERIAPAAASAVASVWPLSLLHAFR